MIMFLIPKSKKQIHKHFKLPKTDSTYNYNWLPEHLKSWKSDIQLIMKLYAETYILLSFLEYD